MKPSENVTEKNKKKELEKLLQLRAEELRQHKREQQIALALERVQDKALTMKGSNDISETTALFFHELNRLGIEMERCGIVIFNDTPVMEVWSTPLTPEQNQISKVVTGKLDSRIHPMLQGVYGAWQKGKKYFSYTLKGDEVKKYYEKLNQVPEYQFPETTKYPETQIDNCFYFNNGHLFVYTKSPLTEEVKNIFHRFTKMFSLAYTRYLDIKKAEEQAREAQISAALERVRASSNGMQKSDELANVIVLLDAELHKLGVNQSNSVLMTDWDINNLEAGACLWLGVAGQKYLHKYHVPFNKQNQIDASYLKARKNNITFYTESYTKAEKNKYFRYHFKNGELGQIPEERQKFILDTSGYSRAVVALKNSGLFVQRYSDEPFTEEQLKIIERFGNVFEQTYTRFLDLQKAEKQAREAEIEAALERVRAKAMAMRSSKDISDATAVVFNELSKLGIEMDRCGIATYNETPVMELWSTPLSSEDKQVIEVVNGYLDYRFNSLLIESRQAWENNQDFFSRIYTGDEVKEYYTHLREAPDYNFPMIDEYPEKHVVNIFYFEQGHLFIWTQYELNRAFKDILKRFTKEFSGTYTRYLDIKKAEAQARESQIEAALERVRAKAMAMHSSKDISDATAIVFNELTRLGIEMERCGIGIYDETPILEIWSTPLSPENKRVIDVVNGKVNSEIHPMLRGVYKSWKAKKDYFRYELKKEEVKPYYELLGEAPEYKFPKADSYNHRQINNVFYFNKGAVFAFTKDELTEEAKRIFKRFTNVFSLTYHRYLDIVRAETQAREAQVEASLERVRAKAMAMHSSKDISDATAIVFNELTRLGIDMVRAGIVILDENSYLTEVWSTRLSPKDKHVTDIVTGFLNFEIHPMLQEAYRSWKKEKAYNTYELRGNEVREYYELLAKQPGYNFPKTDKYPERQILNGFNFNEGHLFAYTEEKLTDEEKQIINRFAKVFSHTYRRYQDLIKAEAQAREAQIEASLERVRAKAMSMHSSKDISGATTDVFNELTRLGVQMERCGITLLNDTPVMEVWSTPLSPKNKQVTDVIIGNLDTRIHPLLQGIYKTWTKKKEFFTYEMEGEEIRKYYELLEKAPEYRFPKITKYKKRQVSYVFYFKEGGLFVFTENGLSDETKQIFLRFTKVFSLTYRRYLDIKKAEAQAREAQIEASLERVRAKAMAMRSSKDISGATAIVFNELTRLGVEMERCGIGIFDKNSPTMEIWSTPLSQKNKQVVKVVSGRIKSDIHEMTRGSYQAWKNKNDFFLYELKGAEVKKYYQLLEKDSNYNFPKVTNFPKRQILNSFNFNEGAVFVYTRDKLPDETKRIIHRFSNVFSLTYKRYQDLVYAEKQAREAKIEAALERVRAKAMAMHNSEDISGATAIVFDELTRLGIEMERCGIVILDDTPIMEVWSTLLSPENRKVVDVISGKLDSKMHVMLQEVYKAWMDNKEFFSYTLDGEEVRNYYDKLEKEPGYRFPKVANYPHQQIANCFYFNEGYVFAYTVEELSEDEKHVFQRFTSVFSLTYRRYLDLIKAEAQAREAIKQASLNRVRGEIASMRNAEDLKRITPVIWQELKKLEVPFIRCGVFIISDETDKIKAHLSTPSGEALAVLDLKFDENKLTKNLILFREKNEVYKVHWNKADFLNWMKSMMKSGQVQSAEKYQGSADAPESLHLHFIPFKQGMLYVGNTAPLSEEELKLANSLSQSFSVAYARYEDFKNLEVAKEQIEKTLDELKAAQTQLVHSEKMASLGELTAGIAHEIQNPLNFVNNFSELSNELLDELKEEMDAGNNDEVKELADDVIQNLKKINHHGKRADAIVKGMLQHSQTSTGKKEPTDINKLADEYLRLSYHGLRAKDKSFNADFKTEFDETLPKINVISQDIGRVLLNLINNAFYAVSEARSWKHEAGNKDYKPEVIVSTKKIVDKIEISVKDNGKGIPQHIMDKIFQPFFTTKPTGQGTGLGLSLSYDIVKAHGGKLRIETEENEGTQFIIEIPLKL